jgi:hypothetical protein
MIWSQSTTELALGFGIGLAVGVLVGVERERHAAQDNQPTFAGIRTFPKIMPGGREMGMTVAAVLLPAALAGAILAFVML